MHKRVVVVAVGVLAAVTLSGCLTENRDYQMDGGTVVFSRARTSEMAGVYLSCGGTSTGGNPLSMACTKDRLWRSWMPGKWFFDRASVGDVFWRQTDPGRYLERLRFQGAPAMKAIAARGEGGCVRMPLDGGPWSYTFGGRCFG